MVKKIIISFYLTATSILSYGVTEEFGNLEALQKHLLSAQNSFDWLKSTKDTLVRNFSGHAKAEDALINYLKVAEPILNVLKLKCDDDSQTFIEADDNSFSFSSIITDLLNINDKVVDIDTFKSKLKSLKISFSKIQEKRIKPLQDCLEIGLDYVYQGEGLWDFEKSLMLENSLKKSLKIKTDPIQDFLSQENKEILIDDFGLSLTWLQLGQRLLRWESFLARSLPKNKANELWKQFQIMKDIYLGHTQLSNTPSIKNGKVSMAWRKSLENFVRQNKNSILTADIQLVLGKYQQAKTF